MAQVVRTDTGLPEMSIIPGTRKMFALGVVLGLTLACNILSSSFQNTTGRAGTRTPLPTLTPTIAANSGVLPQETNALETAIVVIEAVTVAPAAETDPIPVPPTETLSPLVAPASALEEPSDDIPVAATPDIPASPEPTSAPAGVSGWTFANVQTYANPYGDGMLIYGDIVNGTGSVQEIAAVTGTFFDTQGEVVSGAENVIDYWPFDVVPVEGRLPFELTVLGSQQIADFELVVDSRPSDQVPHQNFNVANIEQLQEDGVYCLLGELENRGDFLNEYVLILAVLFDGQDQMLNFGEYYEPEPVEGLTEFPLEFDICVDVGDKTIDRYEWRAWGE
jgi:hypothetical protein